MVAGILLVLIMLWFWSLSISDPRGIPTPSLSTPVNEKDLSPKVVDAVDLDSPLGEELLRQENDRKATQDGWSNTVEGWRAQGRSEVEIHEFLTCTDDTTAQKAR